MATFKAPRIINPIGDRSLPCRAIPPLLKIFKFALPSESSNKYKQSREMFQVSATAAAKKYGNMNFMPKNGSNPKSTSIKIDVDPGDGGLGQYGSEKNISKPGRPQIVVIGVSLDHLSRSTQLFICCTGVFVFYLIYGYVQVAITYRVRVGKCSYISCSYMFLYYIRNFLWNQKCSYIFLYYSP